MAGRMWQGLLGNRRERKGEKSRRDRLMKRKRKREKEGRKRGEGSRSFKSTLQ